MSDDAEPPDGVGWAAELRKCRADSTAFFAQVRRMDDAAFVEAVRDFNEQKEDWMSSKAAHQCIDRELRCRELLKKGTT